MSTHHQEEHFESSEFIKDIVIGMADGLTVPFALAAGLSGAVDSNTLVVTAGIAEIAAGSIAMGLGGYLSGVTEREHYDSEERREYYEVKHYPEKERQEIKEIFALYGISEHLQNEIADELAKDEKKYVDFMMRYELGLERPDPNRARNSAITIGISYVVGGLIPLLPYMVMHDVHQSLLVSAAVTLVALFVFGFFKSRITGQQPFAGALRTMLIGAAAAAVAYAIAAFSQRL
ncbi:MAG: VIT1/CCC1 transporter family protein [Chitinophagales bacterium]